MNAFADPKAMRVERDQGLIVPGELLTVGALKNAHLLVVASIEEAFHLVQPTVAIGAGVELLLALEKRVTDAQHDDAR
ncbi:MULTISPECIES: hypothetical protein [Bradyrhizobium]|uniref:hypothetical protein n=1 Tax=Bradyrhizobium TaxID=374 RepID=UPI00048070EE|nr:MULTISPECIES: hypothetical protein [Bradyrhizobium]QOG23020.1 hypothetical protein FOM02_42970 [Bradyrhizobium sp. SEMIA]UFW50541.1 hypothetical protein BaraCB756_05675 [Bradyrhizobium arachidis]